MPPHTAQLTGELHALLTAAAFAPVDPAFLLIAGSDATRWLNGMVTNSIQALNPGEGNYNFLLNAQGRIQGDCIIYREPEASTTSFLLETSRDQMLPLQALLDKFIIMDDVDLIPAHEGQQSLELLGPELARVLPSAGVTLAPEGIQPFRLYDVHPTPATTPAPGLVPRIRVSSRTAADRQALGSRLEALGAVPVSATTLEQLRLLEARPRYGTDIRNSETAKDLPQETNQPHALHFSKGCYLGQEVVERIRSRGQVHRQFTPFRLEGAPPTSFPTPLEVNGKPAGELTSAIAVPTTEGELWLALGYARREFLETHAPLRYSTGIAHTRAPGQLA